MRSALTNKQFIEKSIAKHGNKFDYSLTEYCGNKGKVKIICNKCNNVFIQTATRHLCGDGCSKCGGRYKYDKNGFIEKAKFIHGDKFDYTNSEYVDAKTKILIKCNDCDYEFYVKPGNHIHRKSSCAKCSKNLKLTTEDFINRSKLIHGDKYIYTNSTYSKQIEKVTIYCPICDKNFKQRAQHHMNGSGCPDCCDSHGEREIANFLSQNNINFIRQYGPQGCVNIKQLYFDFYLPDYNILIEFDGEQHYKPIPHFGGISKYKKLTKRDKIKSNWSVSSNIKLYRIKYNDDLVYELKNILNREK